MSDIDFVNLAMKPGYPLGHKQHASLFDQREYNQTEL